MSSGCVYKPVVIDKRDGKKRRRRGRFYWAKFVDADGDEVRRALKLSNGEGITDKEVARTELRKLLNRVEREASGLIDVEAENRAATLATPIRVALANYLRFLRRSRKSKSYIKQSRSYMKWLIEKGALKRLADFTTDTVDRTLGKLLDKDRSPRTVNVYRNIAHAFAEWAVRISKILESNPISAIAVRDESVDIRKERRSLAIEQARKLLAVCGPRRLFYTVQCWSGLRVAEVAALQWGDFRLDGDRPSIRLRARATKSKRADELPLHSALATMLRESKPPFARSTDKVFVR